MKFLAALQFLTTIPVFLRRDLRPEEIGGSTTYFPIVGIIVGLILVGLNWLLSIMLPPAIVHVLLIVSLALLTGGLHLEGFVDTCDGIAGHRPVEERWRIMHDSRTGAFGVIGAVLLLLVKYVSLSSLPGQLVMTTLVFMPVVSRWVMVYSIFAYPYARPSGLGQVFKQATNWPKFTVATALTFAVAIVLIPMLRLAGLATIIGVWIITVAVAGHLKARLAGLTGDTYGAINEIAEVSVLILITLFYRVGLA